MQVFNVAPEDPDVYPDMPRGKHFPTKEEAFAEARDVSADSEARVYKIVIDRSKLREMACACLNGDGYAVSSELVGVFVNGRQKTKLLKG